MAFTRAGNREAFLEKSGSIDVEGLQRAIETGDLLRRYDLDTAQNITRYHRQTPSLVGGASVAPNTAADPTLDHLAVTPFDPATATSPGYNLGAMIAQYLPLRDCFYHRDKQREVAKGLDDLYKELQRVQNEVVAPHPTNPGLLVTTKRKLTAAEAGKIIGQRRYHVSRGTLEQLSIELGYVGEVDIQTPVPTPYGYTAPAAPATPGAPTYRTPTPDDVRAAYQQPLSWKRPQTYLQRIPEGVLAVIRDGALVTGAIAGSGLALGAVGAYAAAKGGQIAAGLIGSGISHVARRSASDYITSEDGLQNFAQMTGKLSGLAAYSATASLATATLAVGWVTGTLAGSAITRYIANRKRQNARDKQRQLEDVLQTGGIDPTLATQIQNDIRSAEKYEAASATFDIASLLGVVGGVLSNGVGMVSSTNDTEAPSIDKIEYSTKTDLCKGDKVEFSFTAADNKDVEKVVAELYTAGDAQDALQAKLLGVPSSVTALQDATVHQDGITDINVFGKDVVEGNGSFTINDSGDYKVLLTATDAAGNSTSQLVEHTYTIGNCESTVDPDEPPVCPVDPDEPKTPSELEDCVKERFSYGKNISKGVELREVYDYHTTPLKPEAGHEQGLTLDHWKGGSVSLNGVYDEHTPCDFNVDNTVVMLEHYTDAKALDYRVLVDVDASGHFEIPKEFAAYNGDDIQVTWAEVTHCEDGKLGLEDLASYTHGNHVVIPKEAVFEGSVPTHVAPHYVDCDGSADATPAPKHTDVPKDDCGPCKTACDKEYYLPVGVVDTKAGPCPDGAPVMTSSGFVPAGTLDTVVNTFGYMPSDVSGTPVDAVPGSVDATLNPFGYTPDAAAPLSAPGGTLDATPNPFDGVAPAVPAPTGAPSGTLSDPVDPFDVDAGSAPADPLVYNLGHYYQETYYIDDEVLRAFERQQQAALELRLV
ncbi:hypothetical protein HZC31_06420 [Candidatus Woesearchaeota archaeon]|nr:hypothetical protein [Candidatus Woesearchaeota archaeon]